MINKESERTRFRDIEGEIFNILYEEANKLNVEYDLLKVLVYDIKTVGVQGDRRTYNHVAEICICNNYEILFNHDLLAKISNRITNEVVKISRVVYLTT